MRTNRVSEVGTGAGAVAGGIVGALLGPAGIAFGLIVGGVLGSHVSSGRTIEQEPEALAEQLREAVPRSASALVLIAPAEDVTEMLRAVGDSAAGVVRESLTAEAGGAGSVLAEPGAPGLTGRLGRAAAAGGYAFAMRLFCAGPAEGRNRTSRSATRALTAGRRPPRSRTG